jgi:hypothetical protein
MTTPVPTEPAQPPIDLAPYAGRWIAIVRYHVSGVGLTPREAKLLAKLSRPKDEPLVVFVPVDYHDRTATWQGDMVTR